MSICAHASVGWIAAVMLAWLLIPSVVGVSKLFGIRLPGYVWLPVGGGWSIPAAPLGGFFLGMLWFEWLVYTGVRQCKFANRARPGPSMPESPKS